MDIPAAPSSFYVDEFNQIDDTTGAIRLRWDHSSSDVYTNNVYRENSNDTRTLLWGTPNNACFVAVRIMRGVFSGLRRFGLLVS